VHRYDFAIGGVSGDVADQSDGTTSNTIVPDGLSRQINGCGAEGPILGGHISDDRGLRYFLKVLD
jgi:hypothetical protein